MADYNAGASLTASVTACTTALQTLQRLGCSEQAEPMLSDAEQTGYGDITDDTTRSDAWKLQRIANRYISGMAILANRLTAAADIASAKYKQDASAVFGTALLPGRPRGANDESARRRGAHQGRKRFH